LLRIGFLGLLFCFTCAVHAESKDVVIFAASSLTEVLNEVGEAYTKQSHIPVKFSFAASSALARQIESGAPAQVFFSADIEWMDYLQSRKLIERNTRQNIVGNRLVLIAPANSTVQLTIGPHMPILQALRQGRLATGDPDSVPVGKYARSALMNLGVWSDVANRLVRADNVRTALTFVARGEAPLGIVYATDARAEKRVRVVDSFPEASHSPIRYPAALVTGAGADARAFLTFLEQERARALFAKYGFDP
jgi:molybdate transport system substrate-binding protein